MLVRQVTGSLDGMERKRNKQSYVVVGGCGSSWCIRPSNPALGRKLCFETYFLLFKSSRPSFFRHLRHRHLSSISILSTIHDSQSAFVSKWKEENMYFVLFVMRVLDWSSIFPLARFSFSIFLCLLSPSLHIIVFYRSVYLHCRCRLWTEIFIPKDDVTLEKNNRSGCLLILKLRG